MKDKNLLVSRIEITNILGIKHLEFKPGAGLTIARGENASGKTSIITAIQSIFKGGNDATILRKGAEKGEIVIELTDGVKIERTVTAGKSATLITHPTFGQIGKPAAFLAQLIDQLGLNPVEFLMAPAKVRTQLLLEAMPLKLDNDLIEPIIGHTVDELDTNPLELITREIKRFYDDRTGVNRVAKEKRATILQMKQTLPEDAEDTDWARVVKATETSLSQAVDGLATAIAEVKKAYDADADKINKRVKDSKDEIRQNAAAAIQKIQDDEKAALQEQDAYLLKCFQHENEEEAAEIETLNASAAPERDKLTSKLAVARENLANQSKINQTKEYIATLTVDAETAEAQSEKDTNAIEALEKLKRSLLETLPIRGIEIREGEIFVDQIPFDRVNTARKVDIAMEIAQLRSGKLPLMIVDGLELMDSKTFAAFVAAAKKSKVQMIVTRVSDSALAVEA